jgi:hypothetical protein
VRRRAALSNRRRARAKYVDELENFTSDWNHLNVRGSARAAEIVWPAVIALLES